MTSPVRVYLTVFVLFAETDDTTILSGYHDKTKVDGLACFITRMYNVFKQ